VQEDHRASSLGSCIVAWCVDFSAALDEWGSSSPLISVSIAFVFHFLESDWHWLALEQHGASHLAEKATASPPRFEKWSWQLSLDFRLMMESGKHGR
jgi:hypothetical protein